MSSATDDVRYLDAIHDGIAEAMERDDTVILMGIDVGAGGGIFTVTRGLYDRFGPERVIDTPISEMGYVGAAVGASMTGLRPIVEIMFMDFLGVCLDPLLN
jgi:acetoin:2,6-dichlorophenolindophenol oxidoreductase subunit beta